MAGHCETVVLQHEGGIAVTITTTVTYAGVDVRHYAHVRVVASCIASFQCGIVKYFTVLAYELLRW